MQRNMSYVWEIWRTASVKPRTPWIQICSVLLHTNAISLGLCESKADTAILHYFKSSIHLFVHSFGITFIACSQSAILSHKRKCHDDAATFQGIPPVEHESYRPKSARTASCQSVSHMATVQLPQHKIQNLYVLHMLFQFWTCRTMRQCTC